MLRAVARSGTDLVLEHDGDSDIERADALAQRRILAAALAELRPVDRDVLLLHAWADLSDAEVAEALSLPIGTVKSRLHRARQQLQNRLVASGQSEARVLTATTEENR